MRRREEKQGEKKKSSDNHIRNMWQLNFSLINLFLAPRNREIFLEANLTENSMFTFLFVPKSFTTLTESTRGGSWYRQNKPNKRILKNTGAFQTDTMRLKYFNSCWIRSYTDVHGPQRMNPTDFGDPFLSRHLEDLCDIFNGLTWCVWVVM